MCFLSVLSSTIVDTVGAQIEKVKRGKLNELAIVMRDRSYFVTICYTRKNAQPVASCQQA